MQHFRQRCATAEAVILAVPEYAFGIPGSLKNALDWTVGSGALSGKRVAVVSVAPRGRGAHVRGALELVLDALDCRASWHHIPIHPSLVEDGELHEARVVADLLHVVRAAGRAPAASLRQR